LVVVSGGGVEVTLREYRAGDAEAMHTLDEVCFEPVFRFSRRAMRAFAEAAGAVTVLAEQSEELAGFAIVQMEGRVGYVVTLDVAPAWRRCGLAGRLMREAEARVRAAGGVGMELHVFVGNVGAVRFYEGIGYGRVGLVEGFYGRGLDALVYGKRLE
jgi:[ribosomal protein S18]-alanine N-acetyltransferase